MDTSLVFIAGVVLVVVALAVSAVGMTRHSFPPEGALRGILAGAAVIVVAAGTGAVLNARHEQRDRRDERAREAAAKVGEPGNGGERAAVESGKPVPIEPGDEQEGKHLFESTCGTCHTLAAAGADGKVGPDLDSLKPNRSRVLSAIAKGGASGSGQMPIGLYHGKSAEAIADFVASATR